MADTARGVRSTDSPAQGVGNFMTAARRPLRILPTRDLESALGFYRDLLGFALAYRIPAGGQAEYAHLTRRGHTAYLADPDGRRVRLTAG
jgi:hypothetical protein